ncbi:fungal-specific transcription factor domain-containing protein [Mycena epipterygia]|nr:fungal-specific transcription factor domain-containing protein [Mycena epipterygia]
MSTNREELSQRGKNTRIQNAPRRPCDVCRRRKSTGEGSQMPGAKCSACLDGNLECTYLNPAKKRETKSRYVAHLELRLEQSEVLINHLRTEVAMLRDELAIALAQLNTSASPASGASNSNSSSNGIHDTPALGSNSETTLVERPEKYHDARSATLQILRTALHSVSEPPPAPHPDDLLYAELERKMDALSMNIPRGFTGKSSDRVLVKAAIDLKADLSRGERPSPDNSPLDLPFEGMQHGEDKTWTWTARRPEYWMFKPWSTPGPPAHDQRHTYCLPPPDLVAHLAELYFSHAHIYLPVLHRPTFERSVEMGMYCWDDDFAGIVLLVCAIGSRWSDDPRVLSSAGEGNGKPHLESSSIGLCCGSLTRSLFEKVKPSGKHFLGQGTLCDLQHYCVRFVAFEFQIALLTSFPLLIIDRLFYEPIIIFTPVFYHQLMTHFLLGSAAPQACWMLVGIGLRLAQDAGAHRRTPHAEEPSVERELWKRAFWVLVYLDRYVSSLMGRTCAIQYDDFDVEPPFEVDDEYWEDPTHPFQQPSGVPSRIAFFNALLRLSHILAFTLKILYSLSKFRVTFTVDEGWDEHFVADLDSALNRWRDQMPEHLAWDPARADPVSFDQSVALHCAYCHLQILVHRSFIPTVRMAAPTGLPSMAVCTSAARACANMVDIQRRRKGNEPVNFHMSDVFNAALVLMLNVWSGKRGGLPDPSRDLENVHKCMEVLRLCEDRWPNAGMLWDALAELASVGQLPVQSAGVSFGHEYDEEHPGMASETAQPISAEEMLRMMFKSPSLPHTFASAAQEPQYPAPYAPGQEYFTGRIAGGAEIPPIDADAFAANTWPASDAPFFGDQVPDATATVAPDLISTWVNAPTGFDRRLPPSTKPPLDEAHSALSLRPASLYLARIVVYIKNYQLVGCVALRIAV